MGRMSKILEYMPRKTEENRTKADVFGNLFAGKGIQPKKIKILVLRIGKSIDGMFFL